MATAIEGRRKQLGLKSKGEVIERLLDWMTKEPVDGQACDCCIDSGKSSS